MVRSHDEWYELAREVTLRRLDSRANTRAELAQVLARKGVPDDIQAELLDRFEELGLVDDADFADRWTASRHGARGLSRRAVAQELRRKGIDPRIVERATSTISAEDELAAATRLAEEKLQAGAGVDEPRLTRRVVSALARKGYGPQVAWQALRRARERMGDGPPGDGDLPEDAWDGA